ncbi:MAG: hypothetical protein GWP91_00950 [Rhodobacterales bacterium]|nr:hypothetical protein [Rhodobacterales bacterium]
MRLLVAVAIDGDGFIVASRLTGSTSDDAATGTEIVIGLGAIIERFTADGGYDSRALYEAVSAVGSPDLKVVLPSQSTAVVDAWAEGAWRQRDEALEQSQR